MREIKFRGMDLHGRWFKGNVTVIPQKTTNADVGAYITNKAGVPYANRVRPETVGQYTGMKDSSGHEIYEGDIVQRKGWDGLGNRKEDDELFEVVYLAPQFYLRKNPNDNIDVETFDTPAISEEIVGNIYENPELL